MKYDSRCICIHLRRIARSVTRVYDDALAPSGLTLAQYSLLRAIERNEPAPIGLLAEEMELDRTTLARNLRPLARDALLATAVSASDRRVTEARLTARGRSALRKAQPLWRAVQADVAARIGAQRVATLRRFAAELPAALGASATRARESAR